MTQEKATVPQQLSDWITCTCSGARKQIFFSSFCFFFFLPVHPHRGAQNVTNSAKSVLLAAKAIVKVARCCCGATLQLDAEGWDAPALPSPPPMGTPAFHFFCLYVGEKLPLRTQQQNDFHELPQSIPAGEKITRLRTEVGFMNKINCETQCCSCI